jgi:hypothetical protein
LHGKRVWICVRNYNVILVSKAHPESLNGFTKEIPDP